MKRLITFSAVMLFLSTALWAASPVQLHVHQTSGSIYSVALQDVSSLTFASSNLQINGASAQEFPLTGVQKITFDKPATAVENVQTDAACKAFVSNGTLIVEAEGIHALQIVTITGQLMFAQQYAHCENRLEIDAQAWTQGMYLVLLQTANGNANSKIML